MIKFKKICEHDNATRVFEDSTRNEEIWVENFENGIASIWISAGISMKKYAEMLEEFFEEESNFAEELARAYGCSSKDFIGIKFEANGGALVVTKENAHDIFEQWETAVKISYEVRKDTPEFQERLKKALEEKEAFKRLQEEIFFVDKTEEICFKDAAAKEKWKTIVADAKNTYKKTIVNCACLWSKYMQYLMAKEKKSVAELAFLTYERIESTDTNILGYNSDTMKILAEIWKYGEELREVWENSIKNFS